MSVENHFVPKRILAAFLHLCLIILLLAPPSFAQESIATFPLLPPTFSSIKVFDRQGRFVGRIMPEGRYWTPIERIPLFLRNAVVAVEDSRFYEHGGIDVRGIARALVKDVVKRRLAEGGSTITQQLIKNRYLSAEKTLDRKFKEGMMAVEFEKKYTKNQILEMYFNEIYYGNGAWGIAQAARLYFDKNPEELSEAECAILAGVQKNPGRYNPYGEQARVTLRRDAVLKRMVDTNMITPARQQQIRSQRAGYTPASQSHTYLQIVKNRLVELYGPQVIDQGGLDVTASLDLELQNLAEKSLKEGVGKVNSQLQGALVSLDPRTGDLLAVVGGVDVAKNGYNRALVSRRQPGSSIKPLIYAAALEKGVLPTSVWDDTPVSYSRGNGESWTPKNYGNEVQGSLTLRQALALSNNVVTVKLLENIGIPAFGDLASRVGLPLRQSDLSLALGTEEVTLRDLVLAYAPLANGGDRVLPRSIVRIIDRRRSVATDNPVVSSPAIDPAAAYVTTRILQDVLTSGTAKSLKKFAGQYPAAGKTGTTSDYKDAWFVGYTPRLVTGVWVGYDKPRPGGKGFTGGGVAAPIWERFMRPALAGKPADDFVQPETVTKLPIDPATGLPARSGCPGKRDEYFPAQFLPAADCPEHEGEPLRPIPVPPPLPPQVEPLSVAEAPPAVPSSSKAMAPAD